MPLRSTCELSCRWRGAAQHKIVQDAEEGIDEIEVVRRNEEGKRKQSRGEHKTRFPFGF